MTYYTHDNPNHTLVSRPAKHPVLRVLRIVLLVLLSVLLVCSLTLTFCVAAVRNTITPEYVYNYANSVDFAEFPLPADGTYLTISQLIRQSFEEIGFPTLDSDIDLLFEQFSISAILAGFTQDLTSWLLYNDSVPQLIPEEIAEIALSGLDPSILSLLSLISDPVELLSDILVTPLSTLNTEELFETLSPVRLALSADVLAILVSVCGILAVLSFILCFCRAGRYFMPAGLSLFSTGLLLSAAGFLLPWGIRQLTPVYAEYILSFLQPVRQFLLGAALPLCLAGLILVCAWLIRLFLAGTHNRPAGSAAYASAAFPEEASLSAAAEEKIPAVTEDSDPSPTEKP